MRSYSLHDVDMLNNSSLVLELAAQHVVAVVEKRFCFTFVKLILQLHKCYVMYFSSHLT